MDQRVYRTRRFGYNHIRKSADNAQAPPESAVVISCAPPPRWVDPGDGLRPAGYRLHPRQHLPRLARQLDKLTIIRSMQAEDTNHERASMALARALPAGLPGGRVIGATDRTGAEVVDSPVKPADLVLTLYTLLGVQPSIPSGGRAISDLVG